MSKRSKIDRKLVRATVEWHNEEITHEELDEAVVAWSEAMRALNVEAEDEVVEEDEEVLPDVILNALSAAAKVEQGFAQVGSKAGDVVFDVYVTTVTEAPRFIELTHDALGRNLEKSREALGRFFQ